MSSPQTSTSRTLQAFAHSFYTNFHNLQVPSQPYQTKNTLMIAKGKKDADLERAHS